MLENFKSLKFDGFHLNTNLITKVISITFDKDDDEDCYFEIVGFSNATNQYVVLFYKDCELVGVKLADEENIVDVCNKGIKELIGENTSA